MLQGVNFRAVNEIFSENNRYLQQAKTARDKKKGGESADDLMPWGGPQRAKKMTRRQANKLFTKRNVK